MLSSYNVVVSHDDQIPVCNGLTDVTDITRAQGARGSYSHLGGIPTD